LYPVGSYTVRINHSSSYAIGALAFMARRKGGELVPSHRIAQAEGLSKSFLLKILKQLTLAGVLHSVKGPQGGYRLARPAKTISLLEVLEAVDGPVRGQVPDATEPSAGPLNRKLAKVCDQVAETVRGRFQKVSLADLARED